MEASSGVTFKGNPVKLAGSSVAVGAKAPEFTAVGNDLSTKKLADFAGKVLIIAAVPSLDTGVCDIETKRFNEEAAKLGDGAAILTISRDLPFAQKRWCGAANAKSVTTLSDFRDHAFGKAYGVEMADGPLAGLLARSVFVIDKAGVVRYKEMVKEITTEPNYAAALEAVKAAS